MSARPVHTVIMSSSAVNFSCRVSRNTMHVWRTTSLAMDCWPLIHVSVRTRDNPCSSWGERNQQCCSMTSPPRDPSPRSLFSPAPERRPASIRHGVQAHAFDLTRAGLVCFDPARASLPSSGTGAVSSKAVEAAKSRPDRRSSRDGTRSRETTQTVQEGYERNMILPPTCTTA